MQKSIPYKKDSKIYNYIYEKLKLFWSPKIIAEKWNKENPQETISFSTIYLAIYRGMFKGINPKTITLDNDAEFSLFKELEKALHITVYFADPHSPWQRGSNENTNGLLRFFFSKGFDFRTLTTGRLNKVVKLINSRPRLCLNLISPDEVFCCT